MTSVTCHVLTAEHVRRLQEFARRARGLGRPKGSDPEAFHQAQSAFARDVDDFVSEVTGRGAKVYHR